MMRFQKVVRTVLTFEETPQFQDWLVRNGATSCLEIRKKGGRVEAKIFGPGFFTPVWRTVPKDCLPIILGKVEVSDITIVGD